MKIEVIVKMSWMKLIKLISSQFCFFLGKPLTAKKLNIPKLILKLTFLKLKPHPLQNIQNSPTPPSPEIRAAECPTI